MNHNETKLNITEKLEQLLTSVEEIIIAEENNPDNSFRFELCKQRIIHLYNLIDQYQKSLEKAQSIPFEQPKAIIPEPVYEPKPEPVHESKPEPVHESKPEAVHGVIPETEIEQNKTVEHEPEMPEDIKTPEQSHSIPQETESSEKPEVPAEKPAHQQKIISDKYKNGPPSHYDQISATSKDDSIGSKIQGAPVTDLRKAIGINDRFNFINELFSGAKSDYDMFIDSVSSFASSSQIIEHFEKLSSERHWSIKPSYDKFADLIRRFSITK